MKNSALHPSGICRLIGFAALTVLSALASAADYYVDSRGSDNNNGLAAVAGNAGVGPFATLARLSKVSLQHGDRILLACGDRFQGPLDLTLQSTLPGVLTITQFGDCQSKARPLIDGRIAVPNLPGREMQSFTLRQPVTQVFTGDAPLPRARFPKASYIIFPANSATASDRVPPVPSLAGKDISGAMVYARTQEWILEKRRVITGNAELDSPLRYPLRPNAGIYLTGKAWMLGADDGWAYDHADKALHVRNGGPISITHDFALLQVAGRGAVAIDGIAFFAAGGDAINLKLDGVVNINNVAIQYASGNGISIAGASFAQITDSTIANASLDGIFFAEVKRAVVRRNVVTDAGLYQGPNSSLAAINAHRTDAATIEENTVSRSGYIGIRFSGDARVRGNLIESTCQLLADCAAIYTWRRNSNDVRPAVEISGNAILEVRGDSTVKFGVIDYFSGVYLDEWTRHTTIINNVIVNAGQGVYLHNARANLVEGNFILGARGIPLMQKDDAAELVAVPQQRAEVPNRIGVNTVLQDGAWSIQSIGAIDQNSKAKIRVITGLPSAAWSKFPDSALPGCRKEASTNEGTAPAIVAARVYRCD
jgi:parallel beta-helix repeat protein